MDRSTVAGSIKTAFHKCAWQPPGQFPAPQCCASSYTCKGTKPMVRRDKANYLIQSVAHALDVLEQFSGEQDELGVTELSRRLKLHKNNVFRLLATLEAGAISSKTNLPKTIGSVSDACSWDAITLNSK